MKSIVFIGSRINVLSKIINRKENYRVQKIWALEDSPLHKELEKTNLKYECFKVEKKHKLEIIKFLGNEGYDLLISNGCPFILPVSEIKKSLPNALLINTHPSYLPHLKGKTPINGVFYLDYTFIGATTHYMDDGIDTGNIIFQKKIDLTPDIDQGLVYFIAFNLEGEVFDEALNVLEACNFHLVGKPQIEKGSYFNREDQLFNIDFNVDGNEQIIKKVKSVGLTSQGVKINYPDFSATLHEAIEIRNPYLLDNFRNNKTGEVLVRYSNKVLIRTRDGIIRFSYQ